MQDWSIFSSKFPMHDDVHFPVLSVLWTGHWTWNCFCHDFYRFSRWYKHRCNFRFTNGFATLTKHGNNLTNWHITYYQIWRKYKSVSFLFSCILSESLSISFFSIQKLCPALYSTKTHFMKDCDYVSNSEFSFLKLARKLSFLCWNKHLNSTFFLGMQTYTRPQGFLISKNMIVIFDRQSLTIVKKRSRKSFSLHNL